MKFAYFTPLRLATLLVLFAKALSAELFATLGADIERYLFHCSPSFSFATVAWIAFSFS
jgi:hypothetical protein